MKSFFMGVDVSKGYADFIILSQSKQVIEPNFQLDDNDGGHASLRLILHTFFSNHPDSELFVGMESTGGYENNWYGKLLHYRLECPLHVVRLNPYGVNHHGQAGLQRVITDKISAVTIASYLIAHQDDEVRYDEEITESSSRRCAKFMACLTKQKTQLINQLKFLLYEANPELLSYCSERTPAWVYNVLLRFPTARSLSRARISSLIAIPYVTRKRAEELISSARKSVASASDEITADLIRDLITHIRLKEKELARQLGKLRKSHQIPEIDRLLSFPGIGELSAIGLYLEIGNVERFPSAKKLAAYFGLHPRFKESGDGVSGMYLSKKGRSRARAILFMVMRNAIAHNDHIRNIYGGLLQRGMKPMVAQVAIMHKICRIVYGMLKNKQDYDPGIDRAYQARTVQTIPRTADDKTRRFQSKDERAPISRRQQKKRKEQEKSHAGVSQPIRDQLPAQGIDTTQSGAVSSERRPVSTTERELAGVGEGMQGG